MTKALRDTCGTVLTAGEADGWLCILSFAIVPAWLAMVLYCGVIVWSHDVAYLVWALVLLPAFGIAFTHGVRAMNSDAFAARRILPINPSALIIGRSIRNSLIVTVAATAAVCFLCVANGIFRSFGLAVVRCDVPFQIGFLSPLLALPLLSMCAQIAGTFAAQEVRGGGFVRCATATWGIVAISYMWLSATASLGVVAVLSVVFVVFFSVASRATWEIADRSRSEPLTSRVTKVPLVYVSGLALLMFIANASHSAKIVHPLYLPEPPAGYAVTQTGHIVREELSDFRPYPDADVTVGNWLSGEQFALVATRVTERLHNFADVAVAVTQSDDAQGGSSNLSDRDRAEGGLLYVPYYDSAQGLVRFWNAQSARTDQVVVGQNGTHAGSGPRVQPFDSPVIQITKAPYPLTICTEKVVLGYRPDLSHPVMLFAAPHGEFITHLKVIKPSSESRSSAQAHAPMAVATTRAIYLVSDNGVVLTRLPVNADTAHAPYARVFVTPDAQHVICWTEQTQLDDQRLVDGPLQVWEFVQGHGVTHRVLPALSGSPATHTHAGVGFVMPLAAVPWVTAEGYGVGYVRLLTNFWHPADQWLSAIAGLVSAILVLLYLVFCGVPLWQRILWSIAAAVLGPCLFAAVACVYFPVVRKPCTQCGRKRPVIDDLCPHCHAPWPAPEHKATDMFDREPYAVRV